MTSQEVFNKVVAHLRQQKKPAFDPTTSRCCYRTSDGKKCAVGCLISDEDYGDWMEGRSVESLRHSSQTPIALRMLLARNINLLINLQAMHDSTDLTAEDPVALWEKRLRLIASIFKLEVPSA